MTSRSTVHGFPRIGDHRELKPSPKATGPARCPPRSWRRRQGAAAPGLAAAARRRVGLARPTTSRCTTRCSTPASWWAPCPSATAMPAETSTGTPISRWPGRRRRGMEMTKWFDTNYHYLVPELGPASRSRCGPAQAAGRDGRGPRAGHRHQPGAGRAGDVPAAGEGRRRRPRQLRPARPARPAVEMYAELLDELDAAGVEWVQRDEPILVQDRSPRRRSPPSAAPTSGSARTGPGPSCWSPGTSTCSATPWGCSRCPGRRDRGRPDPGRRGQPGAARRGRRHRRADPGRRGRRRAERLGGRPGGRPIDPRHAARPGQRGGRVHLLLAAARAARPRRRTGPRPGDPALAGVRPAEGGRDGRPRPRAGRGHRGHGRGARGEPRTLAGRRPLGEDLRPGRAPGLDAIGEPDLRRAARTRCGRRPSGTGSACRRCRRPRSAPSPRPASCARPGRPAAGASWTGRLRGADAGRDRRGDRASGRAGAGRARPRGARAQRHGPVLRGAARPAWPDRARLGPVVRQPVRAAAGHRR